MFKQSKQVIIISCAVAMSFGVPFALTGCGSNGASGNDGEPASTEEAGQKEQVKSDYAVSIDNCTVTADYEGAPAIVVDYTFTNNSDKDTSFAVACSPKAFQNGVQLETAIVNDDLGNGYMAEIKSGATIQARLAYKLADQSEVTVEVEELFSFDDVMLAEKSFAVA